MIDETNLTYMKSLCNTLNKATKAYDEGKPFMSDFEWDSLYFELINLENKFDYRLPDSPTQVIKYEVVNGLEKVEHSHKMLSLDKTKDWNKFLQYFGDNDVVGMVKLDGLTCSLEYEKGKLIKAETRGNGIIGENILHNANVIKTIPKFIPYKEKLIIDGEIIITKENFEPFKDIYANQRNLASGSIRLLDSAICAQRNLTFVVWNIIEGFNEENSFITKLTKAELIGFKVVPWTSSFDLDAKEFLIKQAEELGYPIDGLVGRFDDIKYGNLLGETDHHSKAAYAYKFYDEEYETILKDIEWTMGRTGVLTPVAVFEPVETDDSIIERASLHNISIMTKLLRIPFKGQKIKVFKSNMIIPQISWGEQYGDKLSSEYISTPETCPICGGLTKIIESDSGVLNLICSNQNCEGKLINKLDHFCGKKGLDIKGISEATLEKLIDWGWLNSVSDIFTLKEYRIEWIKKPGFGAKSVDNILKAIEEAKKCNLSNFISAIGIPLIGNVQSKELVNYFHTWNEFREAVDNNFDFASLDNFGEVKKDSILKYNYNEADNIAQLFINLNNKVEKENANLDNKTCSGLSFVITGKLNRFKNRDELVKLIEAYGGKVIGSVSSKTNYLINNDINSESSKNITAKKLNIPIITENELIDIINRQE